jgi:SAM-dependent methyltransferase
MTEFEGNPENGAVQSDDPRKFEDYFARLTKISALGRAYKNLVASPILFFCARRFGTRVLEVGCGIGSGILGAYPKQVQGLEINPCAVDHCKSYGLDAHLMREDEPFPVADGAFDCCVLDNVLEHIAAPKHTLAECHRVTSRSGGLIVAVPGRRGYDSDSDHRKFYDVPALNCLGEGWQPMRLFSIPFVMTSELLSKSVRQYCLVAVYGKAEQAAGQV